MKANELMIGDWVCVWFDDGDEQTQEQLSQETGISLRTINRIRVALGMTELE